MLLQNSSQVAAGMTGGVLSDFLWSASDQDLAALVTTFRAEIDNPVAATDHVKIVLDADDRIALVHQPLHHIHQLVHVVEAEAGGGLINQIKGLASGPP